jgi:hypothetical protein
MTIDRLAEVARVQNDADFAAGRMPSRYVEDPGVLLQVATLMAEHQAGKGGGGRARAS